jgi:hypothetical protein
VSSVHGRRRSERKLGPVRAPNVPIVANPQIGSLHAESATSIICHAENHGQRRDLLLAADSVHLHLQVSFFGDQNKNLFCFVLLPQLLFHFV